MLDDDSLDFGRKLTQDKLFEFDLGARVIDVDANEITLGVIVEHHTLRNFSARDGVQRAL
jgi:hypothetical protein